MARVFFAIGLCCGLGACSSPINQLSMHQSSIAAPPATQIADASEQNQSVREIAPAAAMVSVPPALGRVVQVRERRYWNGVYQEVSFAPDPENRGENGLDITVETARARGDRRLVVPLVRPSEQSIKTEIETRFAGAAMQIVNQRNLNAYGEFGLAIGRMNDGARCVFAWQWIDDVHLNGTLSMRNVDAPDPALVSPALVRMRVCRAHMSIDELVAAVQKMHLAIMTEGESVRSLDALVASPEEERVMLAQQNVEHNVPHHDAAQPKPKIKPKPKTTHDVAQKTIVPKVQTGGLAAQGLATQGLAAQGLMVPAPSVGSSGSSYGARYLAPVDAHAQPSQAPQTTGSIKLNSAALGLPPQAFQGPSSVQKRIGDTASGAGNGYNERPN